MVFKMLICLIIFIQTKDSYCKARQCFYVKDLNNNDVWIVLRKQPQVTFEGILQIYTIDEDMDAEESIIGEEVLI